METDKKFMVLKMGSSLISTGGLGWYILYTLCGIRFAVENNFIPVVDWMNCKIPQYDASKVGKENVWEYYFEQPFNIGIEEAYKSNDFFVIDDVLELASINTLDIERFTHFFDKNTVMWRKYFQRYIRIKTKVKEYFDKCRNEHNMSDDVNVIGILARGTDYKDLRPVGHFSPISVDKIFDNLDEVLDKTVQKEIFLATEDRGILRKFEERYTGKVHSVDARRYENIGQDTLNIIYKNENGYDRDIKYLYSLYVISRCSIGIYSACGGGAIASLMRKEPGMGYKFLCEGYNRAKGIIVGSYVEKKLGRMVSMGNKPIMFYALNTLKLIHVKEVDVIISEEMKSVYQKILGCGTEFGMIINYMISDTYNIVEYMKSNPGFMTASKLVLLYTDYFVHGKGFAKELLRKTNTFDGAYVWGVKDCYSDDTESIRINKENRIPEMAFALYEQGNYSLMGKYVFDCDLKEIVKKDDVVDLADILNEYIKIKKLFFLEYERGTIYSKIEDKNILDRVSQIIKLLEELQEKKIGDFMSFRGHFDTENEENI